MKRLPALRLAFMFLTAFGWSALGGQEHSKAIADQPLTIRIYNLAGVPSPTLNYACQDASRILSTAGVNAIWQRRPDEQEAHTVDLTVWKRPAYVIRDYTVVGIESGKPNWFHRGALGYALPKARTGVNATVFYDRIQRLNAEGGTDLAMVLGHVMAHEVGHVLLGSTDHCRTGIMKATWNKTDFQTSHRGAVEFTAEQAAAVRTRFSIQAATLE